MAADDGAREPTGPGPAGEAPPETARPTLRERVGAARERGDELVQHAQQRFEHERGRRSWLESVWQSLLRMHRRGGPLLCGGLAYRVFLWELPAALVAVSILSLFTDIGSFTPEQMAHDLGLGAALAAAIGQAVSQTSTAAWWLLLLGLWLVLWAGRSAAGALRLISQIAWEQPRVPRTSKVVPALVFTGMMAGATILSYVGDRLLRGGVLVTVAAWLVILVGTFVAATFAMALLPRAGRPWLVVLPGAALFALVIRGMVLASDLYFTDHLARVDDLYGSLGIAIVMLLWLYLLSWGWVAAMFVNAGLAGIRGGAWEPATPAAEAPSAAGEADSPQPQ